MRYTKSFKLKVISYLEHGASQREAMRHFGIASKSTVARWAAAYNIHGSLAFQIQSQDWSATLKHSILKRMWTEGWSINQTSAFFNIPSPSTVWAWQERYKQQGVDGLKNQTRGRPSVKKNKKSMIKPKKACDMTPEEMQDELEYLRAENAVLKKQEALLLEKAAQTKKKR